MLSLTESVTAVSMKAQKRDFPKPAATAIGAL
jgi:hypothetical protein